MLIPYDIPKLAEITKTNPDTAIVAMELLKKIGLVRILENGEIYMTQIQNLIGEKSIGAFKKEQQRMLKKHKEDNCPPLCPPDIELELEREIETEQEQQLDSRVDEVAVDEQIESCENEFASTQSGSCSDEVVKFYENNIGLAVPYSIDVLSEYERELSKEIVIYAMKLAVEHNVRHIKYIKRNFEQLEQDGSKNTSTSARRKQKI